MKKLAAMALGATFLTAGMPGTAQAGAIQRACNASDRPAATAQLCRCIQQVADRDLSRSDQRRVSKFFRDPHLAQEVRMSDRSHDEAFWKRYKAYGENARKSCS